MVALEVSSELSRFLVCASFIPCRQCNYPFYYYSGFNHIVEEKIIAWKHCPGTREFITRSAEFGTVCMEMEHVQT